MPALFLAVLLVQSEEPIPKAHKHVYLQPAKECERAAGLLRSDPREAEEILTRIIENDKVKKRECYLVIELFSGTKSHRYSFFPYQFRGRARLALAEKAADRDRALSYLRAAKADFEESIRRGLAGSKDYKAAAEARIEKLTTPVERHDPEPEWRVRWRELLAEGRYAAAKRHIESKGGFLSSAKKGAYLAETETACREAVRKSTVDFADNLKMDPNRVPRLEPAAFDRYFFLPDKTDLVVVPPEYEWCAAVRKALRLLSTPKTAAESLCALALKAIPLVKQGENRWFQRLETFTFAFMVRRLDAIVKEAYDAPLDRRSELRTEAEALINTWTAFREEARKSPGLNLRKNAFASYLDRFPVNYDALKIVAQIEAALGSPDPEDSLRKSERAILDLMKDERRLSIEARRSIVLYQIVAGTLRDLLALETTEKTVGRLLYLGRQLKNLGGVFDAAHFGPKVDGVVQRLRQRVMAE